MHMAIAAIVTAAGITPKDWAMMVQKKGPAGFAITNWKCKQMLIATANWMEKNPMSAVHKRFPRPTYDKACAEIMAGAKEPCFGLSMVSCGRILFQALPSP